MSSTSLTQKLASSFSEKISGLNQFIKLLRTSTNNDNDNNNISNVDCITFLQKAAEQIRHCSGSTTPSGSLKAILASSANKNNNKKSSVASSTLSYQTEPRTLGKIVKTVNNELKVQVISTLGGNNNENVVALEIASDSNSNQQQNDGTTPTAAATFQEGDLVSGKLHQSSSSTTTTTTTSSVDIFVVTGVVVPSSINAPADKLLDESISILRNHFACLVPGVPLVTALSLKESSSWSRLRMSIFLNNNNNSFDELSLIEKLLHHTVSTSSEKRASIISDHLLNSMKNGTHNSIAIQTFRKQQELLSLVASVFADQDNDAVVERSGCTANWWRQKLLFASSPFFVSHILSAFFSASIVWQKKSHQQQNGEDASLLIEDEEIIEFFSGTLLKIVSNVGKHVERILSLVFSASSASSSIDLTLVGPLGLLDLCEETAEALSVISLVLRSWRDLVSNNNNNTNFSSSSTTSANDDLQQQNHHHPQIEIPSHIEGNAEKENTYVQQAAADLYLIAPTTITKAQICVVDAILFGVESVIEHVSHVSSVAITCSNGSNNEDSNSSDGNNISNNSHLWFSPSVILPTIPDQEVGVHPVREQLLRLQLTLLDKIHTQSLQDAEETNSVIFDKFSKIWQQQQQALKLLSQNQIIHQNQQQQMQLLNSLAQKLESSIEQILTAASSSSLNTANTSSSSSSFHLHASRLTGRLAVLKMLKMISHLLLNERVLSVGYRRELSSLMLDEDSSIHGSLSSSNNDKDSERTFSACSPFSALFEPNCVGSWVESDLNSSVLSRTSPRVAILRDVSSEFNGRLVLHGRKVVSKDLKNNTNNSDASHNNNSLGVIVVCAAGQNMWLIWFTVSAVIPLRSNNNSNNQSSGSEDDEEEVALVITLLHHEASLVQALLGAAEMSKQDLLEEHHHHQQSNQAEQQQAGSFCLFFNESSSAENNWLSTVMSQASLNGFHPSRHQQQEQQQRKRDERASSSIELKLPVFKNDNDNDTSSSEQEFIFNSLRDTLSLFEKEFALSSNQRDLVKSTVISTVGSKTKHSSSSLSSVICGHGTTTSGKSTAMIQSAAARAKTIQDLKSYRLSAAENDNDSSSNNTSIVKIPNAQEFKSKMMTMTSYKNNSTSSSIEEMMMANDNNSGTDISSSVAEIRKQFVFELAKFQNQHDEESPTLFVCAGAQKAVKSIRDIQRLLSPSSVNSSSSSSLVATLSQHFNSCLQRCQKAPFINNLLKQQKNTIIGRLSILSKTLSSSSFEKLVLADDERLRQLLSPNQLRCLLQMREKVAIATSSSSSNERIIYPMNRELFSKIFATARDENKQQQDNNEDESFFDEELAEEIQNFSSQHNFGVSILPLSSMENINNNNTNAAATSISLSSDLSLLSRLDFTKHNLSVTKEIENSIKNALRFKCLNLIRKEQEELFSRLLLLNAVMRDFVESTVAQSLKSQPGRVIVVDAQKDLLDPRFLFLLSPCRMPLRSVIVDDADLVLGQNSSSVVCGSALFRSLLNEKWRKGMVSSSISSNRKKTVVSSPSSCVFTLSWDPSFSTIESLKLAAKNTKQNLSTGGNNNKQSLVKLHLLLPLVNHPISIANKLFLASELHSLLQNRIYPSLKQLKSAAGDDDEEQASRKTTAMTVVKHITLSDEEVASQSTNFYLNTHLRKMIAGNAHQNQQNQNQETTTTTTIKEPQQNTVFEHTTLLSRSLARHVSLWSIPVPSFSMSSSNKSSSSSAAIINLQQQEDEEKLNLRRQFIAKKVFFKCLHEAFDTISSLIDGKAGNTATNNNKSSASSSSSSSNNKNGLVFVSESGSLLSVSCSPNMTKLSSLLTNKKSKSLQIFDDEASFATSSIDSLFLIVIPNFILIQQNLHLSSSSSESILGSSAASTSPQLKDLFGDSLTFSASTSTDSSTSIPKLLLQVSGSILCLSTSEIFDQARFEQNSLIIANAETHLHQQEQATTGNKLALPPLSASSTTSFVSSSVSTPQWLRQLVQAASFARAPMYLASSNTPQERANLLADADSIFYGSSSDSLSDAASLVQSRRKTSALSANSENQNILDQQLTKIVQDVFIKKSHSSALEICCPRHQQQVRGFLLFAVDSDLFIVKNNSNKNNAAMQRRSSINSSNTNNSEGDELLHEKQEQERLRKEDEKINDVISTTTFIQKLLPHHSSNNEDEEEDDENNNNNNCSGLFGRCKLACLSRYERCNVRSHMCLEQCHELDQHHHHQSSDETNNNNNSNHQFHLAHPSSCPFLCNKKLPCSHSCAENCGNPCQCSFSETPVVILERKCGENCIIGVDTSTAEKNPLSQFYKHKIIIPCRGIDPAMIDVDHDLPPCQEETEVPCENCGNVIKCLCCDVDTFRAEGEGLLSSSNSNGNSNNKKNPVFCNICRDENTRPRGDDLQKVIMRNKLLAKRTGLLAAAASKSEDGHSNTERVKRILNRHEELKEQSESVLKIALDKSKKRLMSDVMRAKETFGRQEQLLSDLNAHRTQFMNIVRRNV